MHTGATLNVEPFCCLVFHDGYLGFSITNVSTPETLLIDMVYLTESTVPERRSKYQSAKLLVADLFTSLHLEYSSFLKLHNLVEF